MVITARTRNAVTAQAVQGFESLRFRQRRLGLESHKKRFDTNSQAFFLCFFCSRRLISVALGVRNDVAFRCTTLTAEGHGRTNPFASANVGSAWSRTRKGLTKLVKPFSYVPNSFSAYSAPSNKIKYSNTP